jgi:hypothetical protein
MFSDDTSDGRPRTASPFAADFPREKTPVLGYLGCYLGMTEGKLGSTNVHATRISEADYSRSWSPRRDGSSSLSPQNRLSKTPSFPYLENQSMGYGQQEQLVYRKYPTLYVKRMEEKSEILSASAPRGHMVGSSKKRPTALLALPPGSPTSVALLSPSPGRSATLSPTQAQGSRNFFTSSGDFSPSSATAPGPGTGTGSATGTGGSAPSSIGYPPSTAPSPIGDATRRVHAVLRTFLEHLAAKWPQKFRRQRNALQVFTGRDQGTGSGSGLGLGSGLGTRGVRGTLLEAEFDTCLRTIVSADPAPADCALLREYFGVPSQPGVVSYVAFMEVLVELDNEPKDMKLTPFPNKYSGRCIGMGWGGEY